MLTRPTFLGIGAQRAATTRLHKLLGQHPEIKLPRTGMDRFNKEVHFFDRLILEKDLRWYLDQFEPDDERSITAAGEITPAYSTLDERIVRGIARVLPGLKVVFVIRNPIDRLWSALVMLLTKWGRRPIETLPPLQKLVELAELPENILRTDYLRTIRIWSRAFSKDAIHVVLFDDLMTAGASTLSSILKHIGASPDWMPRGGWPDEKVWGAPNVRCPDFMRYYLSRRWLPPTIELDQVLGGRVTGWVEQLRHDAQSPSRWFDAMVTSFYAQSLPAKAREAWQVRRRFRRIAARLDEFAPAS